MCLVFGLCCLLPFFLRAELVLMVSGVLALWCGLSLEGSVLRCSLFWLKLSFLDLMVLPRPATVLPQGGARDTSTPSAAVIFYCCLGERYYGLGAVLPPGRYYHNDVRYYRVSSARYFRTQRGSNFLLPPGGAVLKPRCGTSARSGSTAMTCGTTVRSRARGGLKHGQGEF